MVAARFGSRSTRRIEAGPIRVGVIGTGFGAAVHIPALKRLIDFELVAVCSRRLERAKQVAAEHEIPYAFDDWRDVLRVDLDAVIVATPPYLHHQMVLVALEAGKHILCEKPMGRSYAEARDMARMAERVGVAAMVNHEFRFTPIRRRIKELIDKGYIGEPHAATMNVFRSSLADPQDRPFGWMMEQDKAGGMLGATGSHHIDALRWWLGDVQSVAGAIATMVKRRRLPNSAAMATVDADDNFAFVLRFAHGALATVHVTTTAPADAAEEIVISGSEGMVMAHGDAALYGARRGDEGLAELAISSGGAPAVVDGGLISPTTDLLREWVRAIRTGETVAPSFDDGAKTQEILDGVIRSSRLGRWIDTSPARWPVKSSSL